MHRLDPRGIEPSTTDGYVVKTVGGISVWSAETAPTTRLANLTTVIGSDADFVWDSNDEVVLTEVPA